jgi:hypothetical protein
MGVIALLGGIPKGNPKCKFEGIVKVADGKQYWTRYE